MIEEGVSPSPAIGMLLSALDDVRRSAQRYRADLANLPKIKAQIDEAIAQHARLEVELLAALALISPNEAQRVAVAPISTAPVLHLLCTPADVQKFFSWDLSGCSPSAKGEGEHPPVSLPSAG